ncbi:Uncharacterised protein [uncultured archaeon]|nr:Uncharacterised protein [uncultured archaeon]
MSEDKDINRITDPKTILRETRKAVQPYLRTVQQHSRAIKPRIEINRKWIDYYKNIEKIRPLKKTELKKLADRQAALDTAKARLEIYRNAGRYARTHKTEDLIKLRQAQSKYYEARVQTMPPEEQAKEKERIAPEKSQYDALEDIKQDIAEKCKSLKGARSPTRYYVSTSQRYLEIRTISKELQQNFRTAYEIGHPEKFPDALSNYRATNRL